MKLMRLAMCVAVFAVIGGIALSEDLDVRALQAKLADQEARLNDLQAKYGSTSAYGMAASCEPTTPEALLSRNKNAVVKIGGTINTRYFYRSYDIDNYRSLVTAATGANPNGFVNNINPGNAAYNPAIVPLYMQDRADFIASAGGFFADAAAAGAAWDYSRAHYGEAIQSAAQANGVYGTNGGAAAWATDAAWQNAVANGDYGYRLRRQGKGGDLFVSDAVLKFQIDVNDYFDAYLEVNLQDSGRGGDYRNVSDNAKQAWVRWKNVCNSGFGLLIGRSDLIFGGGKPSGAVITGWTGGGDGAWGDGDYSGMSGILGGYRMVPRLGWDYGRTTQINPYWKSQDGKYSVEASFFQSIDTMMGRREIWSAMENGVMKHYTVNDMGGFSARIKASPIKGLNLSASFINVSMRKDRDSWDLVNNLPSTPIQLIGFADHTKSQRAFDLAFDWRPEFFNRLKLYAQWVHTWNGGWVKDLKSDVINAGFTFDLTKQLTFIADTDWMRGDYGSNVPVGGYAYGVKKQSGWASYLALQYKLPYGVMLEGGWRHEEVKNKDRAGSTLAKVKGDVVYGHLGFAF